MASTRAPRARRGAASGAYSLVVAHGLSDSGRQLVAAGRRRFHDQLPHQLADPLQDLDPAIAMRLLPLAETGELELSLVDWRDAVVYGCGRRTFAACIGSLWRLACAALADRRATQHLSE